MTEQLPPAGQEMLYTVAEAAKILKVEPITVRRKIAQRKIKAFRLGDESGPYRIPQSALNEYMKLREQFTEVDGDEESTSE